MKFTGSENFTLSDKELYGHSCQKCKRYYYVFRRIEDKDIPIVECCVCEIRDPDYKDTFQLKSVLRLK